MLPMIEFCAAQLTPEMETLRNELENDSEVDVMETSCLGNCELCATSLYVLIEGEIVTGKNIENLCDNIYAYIKDYYKKLKEIYDLI